MNAEALRPWSCTPSHVQLARFSAATWNFHRIHIDPIAAAEEGLPGPVVQSTLFAELAWQAVRQWLSEASPELVCIEWRNNRPVSAGQTIRWVCTEVTREGRPPDELVTLSLAALLADDEAAVAAAVTVRASSI